MVKEFSIPTIFVIITFYALFLISGCFVYESKSHPHPDKPTSHIMDKECGDDIDCSDKKIQWCNRAGLSKDEHKRSVKFYHFQFCVERVGFNVHDKYYYQLPSKKYCPMYNVRVLKEFEACLKEFNDKENENDKTIKNKTN